MDHFSPVAPAHIRVLVLPVGRIHRRRFLHVLRRLQTETCLIPLAEVEKKTDAENAFLLAPSAFPQGSLLYRFSAAAPSDQQQQLSPLELFREPLLVLGVVDGSYSTGGGSEKQLDDAAAYLKERHSRVVHRQLVVLEEAGSALALDQSKAIGVACAETDNHASLREAVCEISARFLVELTTYAKATLASPDIPTPGHTARSLQRTASLREDERRSDSGRSTPRTSGVSIATDEGSPARRPLPATSFDQIPSVTNPPSSNPRPESRAGSKQKNGKRSSSQDRVSVQGFGTNTSQEKTRVRGKARVGIVMGSIYMMAGQWGRALPILVEHTTKVRVLSDHLWHAKGLENMMVCMLLLSWSGVDFQVPSICEPVTDRSGAAHAARVAAETKAAAEGTKQHLQLFRLSVAVPDLSRLILSLYRSNEGSLELPFLVFAEATVRLSKLLTVLGFAGGRLSSSNLRQVISGQPPQSVTDAGSKKPFTPGPSFGKTKLSKTAIADMLAFAPPSLEDGVIIGDHITLLAGVASAYSVLGFDRKKAMTIKDLVVRLTGALIQARKLGAAEMGIHPAASLSIDTGADALLDILNESKGVNDLMADVSRIYGANLLTGSHSESPAFLDTSAFGNSGLKFNLFRELAGYCEASPDPYGVLLLTSSLLRAAGPKAAIDVVSGPVYASNFFSREEQMHLATVIHRTVAVSKHLGLSDVQATYWDPFLVRGLEIRQPSGPKAVIDRTKISKVDASTEQTSPGNPLLYDPNASRPGTAAKQVYLLVHQEESECMLTLQNPFDIPVDIEQLSLITDGTELLSNHEPVTLGPLRFQQVSLMVTPKSAGSMKITGCRIKMQGCIPQVFPIIETAWSAKAPLTVKELGLDARPPQSANDLKSIGVEPEVVSATIIDSLPALVLSEASVPESGLMLLEGERRALDLILCNTGAIEACVFEIKDSGEVLRSREQYENNDQEQPTSLLSTTIIRPGESVTFKFEVEGKAGVSYTQAAFYYSTSEASRFKYARAVTLSLDMTVNAALQVQNLEVMRADIVEAAEGMVLVSFDLRNAWPKPISCECLVKDSSAWVDASGKTSCSLAPGEIRRTHFTVPHAGGGVEYEEDADAAKTRFLNSLKVLWKMDDRVGAVDLQNLPLSPDSLASIRGAPVEMSVVVVGQEGKAAEFKVGSFVVVRIHLTNRARRSSPLFVGLSAAACSGVVRDDRRMAVVGSLQRFLPPMAEDEETVVEFVLCPLLAGLMDFEAIVKPIRASAGLWLTRRSLQLSIY